MEDIMKIVEQRAQEKINLEQEKIRKQVEEETEKVAKILEMINNGLLYKIKRDNWAFMEYEVVNNEAFFDDYMNGGEETGFKGIRFYSDEAKIGVVVEVNGIYYYDVRRIIENHMARINDIEHQLDTAMVKIKETKHEYEDMINMVPAIKNLLEGLDKQEEK